MIGISISDRIGIGDKVQFSSLPENYFKSTGKKLVDVSNSWIFDHNPYVLRNVRAERVIDLWNFGPKKYEWPKPRQSPEVYVANAEIWASLLNVNMALNRPRLYQFEEFPFEKREVVLFHTHGKSHGTLPDHVIDHVIKKYKHFLVHVGLAQDPDLGIPKIITRTLWDLAYVISQSRMFIGVDSGPSWIAACYPDVLVKKVRNRPVHGEKPFHEWVPLEIDNIHSHWDDRLFQIHHTGEDDLGFMSSYRRL